MIQETVNEWFNRTHKERYEKNKSYRIIGASGYTVLREYSSEVYPQWWYNDMLHNYVVVNVKETDTQFIVTVKRK